MMIIDTHAHLVPPDLLTAIRVEAKHFPSVRLIEQDGSLAFAFSGGKPTRPVSRPLSDVAARIAFGLQNGVGRITDAMVAVARLLCSGHVTRYANAKFFVPMGAAGLPFVLGRMKRNQEITPGVSGPVEALGRVYTDTILHDPRILRFVISIMGADRIMLGSDMPFPIGDLAPKKIIAEAGITGAEAASITGELAARLFRLLTVEQQLRRKRPPRENVS